MAAKRAPSSAPVRPPRSCKCAEATTSAAGRLPKSRGGSWYCRSTTGSPRSRCSLATAPTVRRQSIGKRNRPIGSLRLNRNRNRRIKCSRMLLRRLIRRHPAPEGLTGRGDERYAKSVIRIHSSPIKEFRKVFCLLRKGARFRHGGSCPPKVQCLFIFRQNVF